MWRSATHCFGALANHSSRFTSWHSTNFSRSLVTQPAVNRSVKLVKAPSSSKQKKKPAQSKEAKTSGPFSSPSAPPSSTSSSHSSSTSSSSTSSAGSSQASPHAGADSSPTADQQPTSAPQTRSPRGSYRAQSTRQPALITEKHCKLVYERVRHSLPIQVEILQLTRRLAEMVPFDKRDEFQRLFDQVQRGLRYAASTDPRRADAASRKSVDQFLRLLRKKCDFADDSVGVSISEMIRVLPFVLWKDLDRVFTAQSNASYRAAIIKHRDLPISPPSSQSQSSAESLAHLHSRAVTHSHSKDGSEDVAEGDEDGAAKSPEFTQNFRPRTATIESFNFERFPPPEEDQSGILPKHAESSGVVAATVRAAQECRRHFLSSETVSDVKPSSVMLDNRPSDSDLEKRPSPFVTTEKSEEEKELDELLGKFERATSAEASEDDLEEDHVPRKSTYKPRKFVLEGVPHTTQPLILRQVLSEAFGSPVAISGIEIFREQCLPLRSDFFEDNRPTPPPFVNKKSVLQSAQLLRHDISQYNDHPDESFFTKNTFTKRILDSYQMWPPKHGMSVETAAGSSSTPKGGPQATHPTPAPMPAAAHPSLSPQASRQVDPSQLASIESARAGLQQANFESVMFWQSHALRVAECAVLGFNKAKKLQLSYWFKHSARFHVYHRKWESVVSQGKLPPGFSAKRIPPPREMPTTSWKQSAFYAFKEPAPFTEEFEISGEKFYAYAENYSNQLMRFDVFEKEGNVFVEAQSQGASAFKQAGRIKREIGNGWTYTKSFWVFLSKIRVNREAGTEERHVFRNPIGTEPLKKGYAFVHLTTDEWFRRALDISYRILGVSIGSTLSFTSPLTPALSFQFFNSLRQFDEKFNLKLVKAHINKEFRAFLDRYTWQQADDEEEDVRDKDDGALMDASQEVASGVPRPRGFWVYPVHRGNFIVRFEDHRIAALFKDFVQRGSGRPFDSQPYRVSWTMDHELRRAEQQERRREKSRTERHLRAQLLEAESMRHFAEQEHEAQSQRETLASNIDELLFDPDESAYSGAMTDADEPPERFETYQERRSRARSRTALTSAWDDADEPTKTSKSTAEAKTAKSKSKSQASVVDPEDEDLSPDDPESEFSTLAQFDEDDPFGVEGEGDGSAGSDGSKEKSGAPTGRSDVDDEGSSSTQNRVYI